MRLLLVALSALALALPALALPTLAFPAWAQDRPAWTFTATPYAWAMGASGNVTAKGQTLDVNASTIDMVLHGPVLGMSIRF